MLVNGKWTANWDPVQATDNKGGFVRQISSFRHWVTPDGTPGVTGEGGFQAEADRYHLYVALIFISLRFRNKTKVVGITMIPHHFSQVNFYF